MKILSALMIALASLIPAAQAATTTADLKQFSKIAVSAPIELDVSVGGKAAFTMTGRADDLAKIIATVKDDTLILKQRKHSGRMEKVTVTIATKQLKQYTVNGSSDAKIRGINGPSFKLTINGSGDVTVAGKADDFAVEINGSGDVTSKAFDGGNISVATSGSGDVALAGRCQNLTVAISGSGDFSGRTLTCAKVGLTISGSGDAAVYAGKSIQIRTSGSSDVDVYGNPESVNNRASGSANLIIHKGK